MPRVDCPPLWSGTICAKTALSSGPLATPDVSTPTNGMCWRAISMLNVSIWWRHHGKTSFINEMTQVAELPAKGRLAHIHTTKFMMTSSNGHIFRVTGLFCGEFTGDPHKGQWRGALMFSLICAWINGWVNTRGAGDFRRHRAHNDVIVMVVGRHRTSSQSPFSIKRRYFYVWGFHYKGKTVTRLQNGDGKPHDFR